MLAFASNLPRILSGTGIILLGLSAAAAAQTTAPANYPADYAATISAAQKEGHVVVYTSTDVTYSQKMIDAFEAKYPNISVDYNDLGTTNTYTRVISEAAAGQVTADIVWSNADDLQMKLATSGYAEQYTSPEAKSIPAWAVYDNTLYGVTLEPIGIGYNKTLLPENLVPHTRADLVKVLKEHPEIFDGKVATFDPEKSGSAFLMQSSDAGHRDDFWPLIELFGKLHGKVYANAGQIRETILSGENVLVFNHSGPYMIEWAKSSPTVGIAFGSDYNLVLTRPAFITKNAPHPDAAKLFLDFMLSTEGQKALSESNMPAIRTDLGAGAYDIHAMTAMTGGELTPVKLDKDLLKYLDPALRAEFLHKWNAARGK